MGVNLYDSTKDFNEVLSELGLTMVKTSDEMRAATTRTYTDALKGFDKAISSIESKEILNQEVKGIAQTARAQGGTLTEKQKLQGVSNIMDQRLAYYGGDAQKAYAQTVLSLGKGGSAYSGTGPLRGMENLGLLEDPKVKEILEKMESGFAADNATQLNAILGSSAAEVSVDSKEFQRRYKNMDVMKQLEVKRILENPDAFGQSPAQRRMIEEAGGDKNQAMLNAIGMGDLAMKKIEQPVLDLSEASNEIAKSTKTLIEQMSAYFKEADDAVPSWYNEAPSWWDPKDTSTPRGQAFGDTTSSRLSQTMGRHASMDGALTGKRTVTSGYRNFGLGSMNSDHVTGRAYDLVGQNLGQYQSLVKSTGGFAEFHGVNGARHLHVVPGSGAMGDRSVPVMSGGGAPSVQMSGGSGGNNYNFYVSGNQNASAKEIADMVMQKVQEVERSNQERR
jgi:hypothetical protein